MEIRKRKWYEKVDWEEVVPKTFIVIGGLLVVATVVLFVALLIQGIEYSKAEPLYQLERLQWVEENPIINFIGDIEFVSYDVWMKNLNYDLWLTHHWLRMGTTIALICSVGNFVLAFTSWTILV